MWRNHSTGHVGWWEMHNGTATWRSMAISGLDYKAVGIGDFNGDGTSDILWRDDVIWQSRVVGDCNGSPAWHYLGVSAVEQRVVGIGDFDGNGTSDVLWRDASNGYVGWWEMNNGTVT